MCTLVIGSWMSRDASMHKNNGSQYVLEEPCPMVADKSSTSVSLIEVLNAAASYHALVKLCFFAYPWAENKHYLFNQLGSKDENT